jgi:hypothetical protein
MTNQFNKSFFAFMARFAIICNVSFIFATIYTVITWLPTFLASFFAQLGAISPVVNLIVGVWMIGSLVFTKHIPIPKWQTIFIVLMLLLQIIKITLYK